ncbi:MAG: electron transfer flavoprotein subunit beta [Coxiella sp. RIFCSPHIGHO2_12_FULL_44_14]|nr:MAG: electron transfer flavoprotein subunit beta [Coxiella sp. RIFCSPHIGHO2_12_FULL_44_14]
MKVLVAVKRVLDFNSKIRIKADGSGVDTEHVKKSLNPFDEIALEEAVRLKEKKIAQEIVVISIGNEECQETLRSALAFGADRAILVKTERDLLPWHVAQMLHAIVEQEKPMLVLLGKQAIDDDCNQTGQMLAGLLDWPQGTFVSRLDIQGMSAEVAREIDEGLQLLKIQLPAVITTDLRLNEPRYTSLPNIVKARNKPLTVITEQDLKVTLKVHIAIVKVTAPLQRKSGVILNNIKELLNVLKEKHGILP